MKLTTLCLLQPRIASLAEGRRLIHAKAIRINDILVDTNALIDINIGDKITIGKHIEIEVTENYLQSLFA